MHPTAAAAPRAKDHLCGFYYGDDERDALLLPFLREGLRAGDKCVAVVDSMTPETLLHEVSEGLDEGALREGDQLELYDAAQTYLRRGTFDAEEMIAFWEQGARANQAQARYSFARVVGEMSWLERVPTPREQVLRYESWADGFAAQFDHAILCMYDLQRLGSGILVDLLRTHPKLLLGGLVLENPHHIPHDERAAASA